MTVTITQRPQLRPTDVFEKWQLRPTLRNQNMSILTNPSSAISVTAMEVEGYILRCTRTWLCRLVSLLVDDILDCLDSPFSAVAVLVGGNCSWSYLLLTRALTNDKRHHLDLINPRYKRKWRAKSRMERHQCSTQYSRCKCKQDYVGVHRILVVPGDSGGASTGFVGAFWAIKDRGTSICGLPVENVITDRLSRVCSWWCIMLFIITKNTGINLWPCVIIYTAPWFPIAFCGIQVVSESYFDSWC